MDPQRAGQPGQLLVPGVVADLGHRGGQRLRTGLAPCVAFRSTDAAGALRRGWPGGSRPRTLWPPARLAPGSRNPTSLTSRPRLDRPRGQRHRVRAADVTVARPRCRASITACRSRSTSASVLTRGSRMTRPGVSPESRTSAASARAARAVLSLSLSRLELNPLRLTAGCPLACFHDDSACGDAATETRSAHHAASSRPGAPPQAAVHAGSSRPVPSKHERAS